MAIDLLGALRDQYEGDELGQFASDLLAEVEEDRELVKDLIQRVGSSGASLIKESGAWLGEKGIRMKLGSPTDYLGTLEALEALALGVQGKLALWRSLEAIAENDTRLGDLDFDRLKQRAVSQHARLEERRLVAARALGLETAGSSTESAPARGAL